MRTAGVNLAGTVIQKCLGAVAEGSGGIDQVVHQDGNLVGDIADNMHCLAVIRVITALIDEGTYRPGERIPSVRQMSKQEGVSISTVLQAYLLLENRGLIEARPQSGYYVRAPEFERLPEPESQAAGTDPSHVSIRELMMSFPSEEFLDALREVDVKYIVVHRGGYGPNQWARMQKRMPDAIDRSIREVISLEGDTVYELLPKPPPLPEEAAVDQIG